MGHNLHINGVHWGYNPFANRLLSSWDIQVSFTLHETNHPYSGANMWVSGSRVPLQKTVTHKFISMIPFFPVAYSQVQTQRRFLDYKDTKVIWNYNMKLPPSWSLNYNVLPNKHQSHYRRHYMNTSSNLEFTLAEIPVKFAIYSRNRA